MIPGKYFAGDLDLEQGRPQLTLHHDHRVGSARKLQHAPEASDNAWHAYVHCTANRNTLCQQAVQFADSIALHNIRFRTHVSEFKSDTSRLMYSI